MIRTDLKCYLPKNWKSLFKHNPSYPETYYKMAIIEINGVLEKLILNENTEEIMDFFYDDKDSSKSMGIDRHLIKWSKGTKNPITIIPDENTYSIKYGGYEITNDKTGTVRDVKNCTKSARVKYPTIGFTIGGQKISMTRHKFNALMYVPNPDPEKYTMINHKDGNTLNCSKENLEWCDAGYNNKGINQTNTSRLRVFYQQIDKNGNIINSWTSLQALQKDAPKGVKKYINSETLFEGYYWIHKDTLVEDYLSRHPMKNDNWYPITYITTHKVEVNDCGIIRVNGVIKLGQLMETRLIYRIKLGKKSYQIHRLIYEGVHGIKLDPSDNIVHTQPVTENDINNEISNLRLVKGVRK